MRDEGRGRLRVARQPLWKMRAAARAPRLAGTAACAVLALVGAKALVTPSPAARTAPSAQAASRDLAAEGFAEAFARAYLTFDADDREARSRALQRFGTSGETSDGAPASGDESVKWAAVVGSTRTRLGRVVTVAAHTTRRELHLAVTVARDGRGLLAIATPPAIVGPPPVASETQVRVDDELEDSALRAVAARVAKNYLALERENLAADLSSDAVVSLPEVRLRVASIDGITWSGRRVAVALTARGRDGLHLGLRYELDVVRHAGRWLVRTVHVNPAAMGGS